MEHFLENPFWLRFASIYLPRIGGVIAILLGAWLISKALNGTIQKLGKRRDLNTEIVDLIVKCMQFAIGILALLTSLGTLGVDVSALVAGLGLTGFAIGLALKDILSNVVAGVLTLLYRPFKRNDRITIAGLDGRVVNVDLRYTTLKTADTTILIPNSTLTNNAVIVHHAEGNTHATSTADQLQKQKTGFAQVPPDDSGPF